METLSIVEEIRFARVKTNPLNGVKGDRIASSTREARSFSSKGRHRVPFEDDWNVDGAV